MCLMLRQLSVLSQLKLRSDVFGLFSWSLGGLMESSCVAGLCHFAHQWEARLFCRLVSRTEFSVKRLRMEDPPLPPPFQPFCNQVSTSWLASMRLPSGQSLAGTRRTVKYHRPIPYLWKIRPTSKAEAPNLHLQLIIMPPSAMILLIGKGSILRSHLVLPQADYRKVDLLIMGREKDPVSWMPRLM